MGDDYDNDDYDFDDFEEEAESPKSSTKKRIGTPHSSKKSPEKVSFYGEDDDGASGDDGGEQEQDVDGQDLETYLKKFSSDALSNANLEDLACELKPLEGVRPKFENAEEGMLMQKLGYSLSNNSSPVKGRSIKISTNSPGPMKQPSFKTIQEHLNVAFHGSDENPSTRTSKDNKTSPNPLVPKAALKTSSSLEQSSGDVSLSGEKKKVKLNTAAFSVPGAEKTSHLFEGDGGENYMMAFKSLTITSPAKQTQQEETLTLSHTKSEQSPKGVPNIADLMLHKRSAEQPSERENAERVDALLMELFPERYQKQASDKKGKGTKTSKKATALALATAAVSAGAGGGYIKNQVYGLAAPRPNALSSLDAHLHPSVIGVHSNAGTSLASGDDGAPMPLMANLDQQLKLLKRELKAKDDKIQRLTEHAVMMGNHMDRLKAEAAHLTVQLREANLELDAKEGRLQEVLKQKKKLKKAAAAAGGGQGALGGYSAGTAGGGDASVALLEQDNIRLREREQALMDAIEELSNQNEDLIQKLKESMERELVLSSKRAAIVSHNVHILAEQHQHNGGISNGGVGGALYSGHHSQSHHHLPHIGARAEAGLRTQSEPVVSEPPKRRKKKASFG